MANNQNDDMSTTGLSETEEASLTIPPLWFTKECLRQAELMAKERADGLNKTKDRASTLLGWMVAIMTATVAYFTTHPDRFYTCSILLAGGCVVVILCILVLVGRKVLPTWFSHTDMDAMRNDLALQSEEHMQYSMAIMIEGTCAENADAHEKIQKYLKYAWVACIATSFLVTLSVLFL